MGLAVLINGESGSGKSASIRNLKKSEVLVFSLHKSRLPFKTDINIIKLTNTAYSERYEVIKKRMYQYQDKIKIFVIDDSDYLMFFEQQQRNKEGGYNKYTEIALHMIDLKNFVETLNDDVIVYFLNHIETDKDSNKIRAITAGKMIDTQLGTFEALFENVIFCEIRDGSHVFITNSDGTNTAKTAMGMFEDNEIDNDLKLVDRTIREYYEIALPYKEEREEEK